MLSIVIMNHNDEEYIIPLLESIKTHVKIQHEVIIVDSGSAYLSKSILFKYMAKNEHDIKQFDSMFYNAGYSRSNNRGIGHAKYETVLLLNPDTLITGNDIDLCYAAFKYRKLVACGVQLQNRDGSDQITANYNVPGGLNILLPLPVIGNIFLKMGKFFGAKSNIRKANEYTECDWINGAFIMVDKAVALKEPLDEDFFLYAEEAEWCGRLKKHGKLAVFGFLHATHYGGGTTEREWCKSEKGYYDLYTKKGRQLMLSNLLRIRKQFGVAWFLANLFFYTLAIPFALSRRFTKNVGILWANAPKIISGKPHFYKVI